MLICVIILSLFDCVNINLFLTIHIILRLPICMTALCGTKLFVTVWRICLFFKIGPFLASFCLFSSFQTNNTIFGGRLHSSVGAGTLQSPPITTRPGLPSNLFFSPRSLSCAVFIVSFKTDWLEMFFYDRDSNKQH